MGFGRSHHQTHASAAKTFGGYVEAKEAFNVTKLSTQKFPKHVLNTISHKDMFFAAFFPRKFYRKSASQTDLFPEIVTY